MLDKFVQVEWPEEEVEAQSNKIKSLVVFPDLTQVGPLENSSDFYVQALESHHINASKPRKVSSGSWGNTCVRGEDSTLLLGKYELTESAWDFFDKGYDTVFSAAVNAFQEETKMAIEATGDQMYAKLWPYFKGAVRSGIDGYHGRFRLKLCKGVSRIEEEELMDKLPDLIVRMRNDTDVLNKRIDEVKRSIVNGWVQTYRANAECARIENNTRTFTRREARAFVKDIADALRAEDSYYGDKYRNVYQMPEVEYKALPFRVAVVQKPLRLGCEIKSRERDSNGKYRITRLQYQQGRFYESGNTGSFSMYHDRLDELVSTLESNIDYNRTMQELRNRGGGFDE